MAYVIEMPKLSDTMEEGGIANWLKKEGESVKVGEPLVEIETDKATQEYESPEDGFLLKILIQPGNTVGLRTPIAIVGEKGESFDLAALTAAAKPQASKAAPAVSGTTLGSESAAKQALVSAPVAPVAAKATNGRVKASPLARKKAAELGVDVAAVAGSGPGGRVVMRDLDAVAEHGGSTQVVAGLGAAFVAGPQSTTVPVTMMRKTIAKRLVAAKNEAPHFYLTISADVSGLVEWRTRLNAEAGKSGAPKVSLNDLVILGVSRALVRHPMVNASWQGDTIIQHHAAHICVAVALPQGLVTPVIRNAHLLGLRDIARQVSELAAKAKDGKLTNDDYAGGTFSISNLGMFGIEEFTAIINPPQAAILAVGAAVPTPWVDAKGQMVVQQRMRMTLSCDHRVVDGAMGAQFLKTLVGFLEDPMQLLV
jgi:pyruvate dehydrogenase E2 component (dihydrolipoamide acetyltransferase)